MRQFSRTCVIGWLASMPAVGLCGSWDITQNINLSNNLMLLQENASNSIQAGNYINLNDSISNASQSVALGSHSVSLKQDHATSSKQALNYLSSPAITDSQQTISGVTNFSLTQLYGSGNLQAGNLIENSQNASGHHTQTITATSATLSQQDGYITPSPNVQAGNAAINVAGTLTQTFVANSLTASFSNPSGTSYGQNNYQAANYVKIGDGVGIGTTVLAPP